MKAELYERLAGVAVPPTRSGEVQLGELSDQEAMALQPHDVVIVSTPRGLAPFTVHRVRLGVASEDGVLSEVPVIDGALTAGARSLAWAVPNLYTIRPLEQEEA
jgi:hypothetical protein